MSIAKYGILQETLVGLQNFRMYSTYETLLVVPIAYQVDVLRDLRSNRLVGPIPSQISSMTNLKTIFLRSNLLTGPIPSQIGRLAESLTDLSFRNNQLNGRIPSQFGLLTSLKFFNLYTNFLTGTIPTHLGNMEML